MQAQKYSIKDWDAKDQPREKLLSKSPSALTNYELLAILINKGSRGRNAVELAIDILKLGNNNLDQLGRVPVLQLTSIKGIGKAKAIAIAAALELGRRRHGSALLKKKRVERSLDVAKYLQAQLRDLNHEVFGALYLSRSNKIDHLQVLSEGGVTSTIADPRVIMRRALETNAVKIVLFHNHPSGCLYPSRADEEITTKIQGAARFFDIKVVDHIIVSNEGYYSFADEGLL